MKCFRFDRYTMDWDSLNPTGSKWSTPRDCFFPVMGEEKQFSSHIETNYYAKSWTGSDLNDCQQFQVWSIPADSRYQEPFHEGFSQETADPKWRWGWCQGLTPGQDAIYHYRGKPSRSGAYDYNNIMIIKVLPITPNATVTLQGIYNVDPRTRVYYNGDQPSWTDTRYGFSVNLSTLDQIPNRAYDWHRIRIYDLAGCKDISLVPYTTLYKVQAYAWAMYRNAEGALWRNALQTFKLHDMNLCTNLIDTYSGKSLASSILEQWDVTRDTVMAIKGTSDYLKSSNPTQYWSNFLSLITALRYGGKDLAKVAASAQLLKSYGILLPAKGVLADINSQQPWVVSAQTALEFVRYVTNTILYPDSDISAVALNKVHRNMDTLASSLEAAYTPQIRSRTRLGGVTCSISAECTFDESQIAENYVRQLHRIGVLPTFEGLWDLVPLSFVIDWISGVTKRAAQALDSSILAAECSTKHYCRSIKVEGSSKLGYGYKVYHRSYSERAPWVGLSIQDFKPGFRIDYLPEGASLLVSSLK